MPSRVPPIARIRLARSIPRLLVGPLLLVVVGALSAVSWLVGPATAGVGALVLAGLGGLLVVIGLIAAAVLLSVRLEVEEAAVRLSWLGGERIYVLTPGPVTRVRLRGENASKLRSRSGYLGWGIGSARLRDEEEIQLVRMARTRTAILVPTERGRLAIAAADDGQLLDALSRAARARQRLDELSRQALPVEEPDEPIVDTKVEIEPHVLTGIERALLEERLAEERAAAVTAADAEREAAGRAAATQQPPPAPEVAAPEAQAPAEAPARAPRRGLDRVRPGRTAVVILLPIVVAAAAWGIGTLLGRLPEPDTDHGRLTSLALVLAGPATSVGAIMARVWWPRLVGVVVAGGLSASLFIGRALIGI